MNEREIPARLTRTYDTATARCGHCGQLLANVKFRGSPEITVKSGWKYDGAVWRPTPLHRAERRKDEETVQRRRGTPEQIAAAKERLKYDLYDRGGTGRLFRKFKQAGWDITLDNGRKPSRNELQMAALRQEDQMRNEHRSQWDGAQLLPVKIECPNGRCARDVVMINRIDADS